MKIYVNGFKHAEIKGGTLTKPLIGINMETEKQRVRVSGVYFDRVKTYHDGTVITVVIGWKKPWIAIFLHRRFPFINVFFPTSETEYLEEE